MQGRRLVAERTEIPGGKVHSNLVRLYSSLGASALETASCIRWRAR